MDSGASKQSGVIIEGIEWDFYMINNPILIKLKSAVAGLKFIGARLRIQNKSNKDYENDLETLLFEFEADVSGEVLINISEHLKAYFTLPDGLNYKGPWIPSLNLFNLSFSVIDVEGNEIIIESFEKYFARAGKNTYTTNLFLHNGDEMVEYENIPYWPEYPMPVIEKVVEGIYTEYETEGDDFKESYKNYIKEKTRGCDSVYIRFLNQFGGNSHYLFEHSSESISNEGDNKYIARNSFDGLRQVFASSGSNSEIVYTLKSEVKAEYYDLIKSLCESSYVEVFLLDESKFIQIEPLQNSATLDSDKNVFDFEFKYRLFDTKNSKIWG